MTVIAYKDGVIAYDSRKTMGETIIDDDHDKRVTRGNVDYFFAGNTGDLDVLLNLDQGHGGSIENGAGALRVENKSLSFIGMNKIDGFWRAPIENNKVFAIGSGQDHALTAMDLGCSAKEAVKMAIKRDSCSGGKIRVYKVK